MGQLPKIPPPPTAPPAQHTNAHTHTQIPGLASAQCWDYRIRTLFHYLPTLYSMRAHTHTQCHSVSAKAAHSVNHNTWHLHTNTYSYSLSPCWKQLFIMLSFTAMEPFILGGLLCDLDPWQQAVALPRYSSAKLNTDTLERLSYGWLRPLMGMTGRKHFFLHCNMARWKNVYVYVSHCLWFMSFSPAFSLCTVVLLIKWIENKASQQVTKNYPCHDFLIVKKKF